VKPLFSVAPHFFCALVRSYRSREVPQEGPRREYEWQDVATNTRDSCDGASRCADSGSRTRDAERQKFPSSPLYIALIVVHRRRVAGTDSSSISDATASLTQSPVFRPRHKRRMHAAAAAAAAASLTSLLPRVEERHNKIHRKTVGPLSYSDYPDNFSVVVADRPSFINPHDEAATRRSSRLRRSGTHLSFRPTSPSPSLSLSRLVPVRDCGISFEVRDYL
jgi:hypothetical protein